MKVITIYGSLKFQNEMMSVSEKLSLEGNCVFMPVYPVIKRKRNKDINLHIVFNLYINVFLST